MKDDFPNKGKADNLFAQAIGLKKANQFKEAVPLLINASLLYQKLSEWRCYIETLDELSDCYMQLLRYDETLEALNGALKYAELYFDDEHLLVGELIASIGECYQAKGNLDEGIKWNVASLERLQKVAEARAILRGMINSNLGICWHGKGNYGKAIGFFQKTIALYQQAEGEKSGRLPNVYLSMGASYCQMAMYQKANSFYKKGLEALIDIHGEQHPNVAEGYSKMGIFFGEMGEINREMRYHQKALAIRQQTLGENHTSTAASYINLGYSYGEKGQHEQQIDCYQKGLAIQRSVLGEQHLHVATSYNNIGWSYWLKGDYDEALAYYEKALSIRRRVLKNEENDAIGLTYNNMGMVLGYKKEYDKATVFFEKSLAIFRKIFKKEEHPQVAVSLDNIASCFERKGDIQKALAYYEQSNKIRKKLFKHEHKAHAKGYNHLGQCYLAQLDYDKALSYFKKALSINLKLFGHKNPFVADCYVKIAQCFFKMEEQAQAINHFHKALISLFFDYHNEDSLHTPSLATYSSPIVLLEALKGKMTALYALYLADNKQINKLHTAYETSLLCVDFVNEIILKYKAESSKLILTDKVMPILAQAIQVALSMYQETGLGKYTEQAYLFSEQSKAIVLSSYLRDAKAKLLANIPPDLLEKEKQLRIEISYFQQKIGAEKVKKGQGNGEKISQWKNQLFFYKQQYDDLITQFETEYPAYFDLKYNTKSVTISDIQQGLAKDTALVEYFYHNDLLVIFVITRQAFVVKQFCQPLLTTHIQNFNKYVNQVRRKPFVRMAHQLYQLLIAPVTNILNTKKQWIIIPGGELYLLPFGALVARVEGQNPAYRDVQYLIRDVEILYHYSATLWFNEAKKTKRNISEKPVFMGFAPVYKERELGSQAAKHLIPHSTHAATPRSAVCNGLSFRELPYTRQEVNSISHLFTEKGYKAQAFLEQDATINNFKNHADQCDYLLIAAHGLHNKTHKQQSGIVFSPTTEQWESYEHELFYISNAYNLDLKAGLVVLSSCESGIGNLVKGEGMMAINRGFLYSGAANVIFTLYKIFDQTSGELSKMLFTHLLEGKTYAAALQQAQLSLIAKKGTNPKSWAGFVLIGIGA